MIKILQIFIIVGFVSTFGLAQRTTVRKPAAAKPPVVPAMQIVDKGSVSGRTYTNETLNFSITFPDTWLIPSDDFEDYIQRQSRDLTDALDPAAKAKMDQSLKRVEGLVTAYRSKPGSDDNAIMRVSAEDLRASTYIKDAVDYFDAIRASYKIMKLPADFKYSETRAERLGLRQFAFLDTSSSEGKTRMYATVRHGFAILFVLSYSSDADLLTMQRVLSIGNFSLR